MVENLTLSVSRGELFGLLGPNGAGKTTTIRMLATLLLPTSGRALVAGFDVASQSAHVRRRIGYVFGGDAGFYGRLTGRENLEFFAEMQAIDHRGRKSIIEEVLLEVDLRDRASERVETYSRGMRQRLHLARGLLNRPEVLFLDEPSIGVDPVAARALRRIVRGLADSGTTVLLTTHYLSEADELCDRVAVINRGKLVSTGTPGQLKASDGRSLLSIELGDGAEAFADYARAGLGLAPSMHRVGLASTVVKVLAPDVQIDHLVRSADQYGRLGHAVAAISLEDAYVALIDGDGSRS